MRKPEKPSIAIVGAGRVGSALARTFYARGYKIAAVFSRTIHHAQRLAVETNALTAGTAAEAAEGAPLVILAVPDDVIAQVTSELQVLNWTDRAVVHTSGGHSKAVLRPLAERGAMTGSLHPAYPFAHRDVSADLLKGVTFAIESDSLRLTEWLVDLVDAAEGQAISLRPDLKPLYHAALVMTSSYAVVLFAASKRILNSLGAGNEAAAGALNALWDPLESTCRHASLSIL